MSDTGRLRSPHTPAAGRPAIFLVAPGGLKDRAGIGRLVASTTRFWLEHSDSPPFRIVDPYGPARWLLMPFYFSRALLQILWNAWRGRIAVLHVHMAARASTVRKGIIVRLGARLGLPVILHLHGSGLDDFYRWLPGFAQRLLRQTLERADRIVVPGQYWHRVVVEEMGAHPARVLVLPNAVSGPKEAPARNGSDLCRILFLGRLQAKKGFPEFISALADQRLTNLDWHARAAGLGVVDEFQRQLNALGLSERVTITGWISEARVREWLAESDIFVLPSHHEGLSMAVLEAMAFGLAIITTPVGAMEDAIVDGVSGLVVPVGNSRALADALFLIITDRALRSRLQAAARQTFCGRFDIATHCRRLELLYEEVCSLPR